MPPTEAAEISNSIIIGEGEWRFLFVMPFHVHVWINTVIFFLPDFGGGLGPLGPPLATPLVGL